MLSKLNNFKNEAKEKINNLKNKKPKPNAENEGVFSGEDNEISRNSEKEQIQIDVKNSLYFFSSNSIKLTILSSQMEKRM